MRAARHGVRHVVRHMSSQFPALEDVPWTQRGRMRVADGRGSQPTSPCVTRMAQGGLCMCVGACGAACAAPCAARYGRSVGAAELTPLRSARVPIGLGLVWTRTNAPQSRTNRPGSQKCPKWPPGKVPPRPFKLSLTVSFRAFTRPVAAIPRWFRTPPSLKTILSHRDLYEVVKFQNSIFAAPRGSWPQPRAMAKEVTFEKRWRRGILREALDARALGMRGCATPRAQQPL